MITMTYTLDLPDKMQIERQVLQILGLQNRAVVRLDLNMSACSFPQVHVTEEVKSVSPIKVDTRTPEQRIHEWIELSFDMLSDQIHEEFEEAIEHQLHLSAQHAKRAANLTWLENFRRANAIYYGADGEGSATYTSVAAMLDNIRHGGNYANNAV